MKAYVDPRLVEAVRPARRVESRLERARQFMERGDCEMALSSLRMSGEAWGVMQERLRHVSRGTPGEMSAQRELERLGESVLAVESGLIERCLRPRPLDGPRRRRR